MNYSNFSAKDFVLDESFQKWILNPDEETRKFWESWLSNHPEKKQEIEEARLILIQLHTQEDEHEIEPIDIWESIDQSIEEYEQKDNPVKVVHIHREQASNKETKRVGWVRWMSWISAACVLMTVAYFFWMQNQFIEYKTRYGEIQKVVLPDNSVVTLNANSTLQYKNNWGEKGLREVWLEGEAFFSVEHTLSNSKFQVHLQDVVVEVLGTKFNVNNRRDKTQVVLSDGKVALNYKAQNEIKHIQMKPGDLVEISKEDKTIEQKVVDTEKYSSWKNNKLEFDETTLAEIAQIIEDNYGIAVVLEDEQLKDRTFTAVYPADDLEILLKALAKAFHLNITKKNNTIFLDVKDTLGQGE